MRSSNSIVLIDFRLTLETTLTARCIYDCYNKTSRFRRMVDE